MTQILKTLFSKKTKTKPLKQVKGSTDSEPQEGGVVRKHPFSAICLPDLFYIGNFFMIFSYDSWASPMDNFE